MSIKKKDIFCPTCNKPDTWKPENKFRPFCSERCKLIDLGAWASEEHAIPGDPETPFDSSDSNSEEK